jgi:hypothetical protein
MGTVENLEGIPQRLAAPRTLKIPFASFTADVFKTVQRWKPDGQFAENKTQGRKLSDRQRVRRGARQPLLSWKDSKTHYKTNETDQSAAILRSIC